MSPNAKKVVNSSRDDAAPFEAALVHLLPPRAPGLLLAACLRKGDVAARAWQNFVAEVGDPKVYFEADRTGLKGLLPFVEASLAANGIDAGRAFHTYARVALVREELRSRIYGEILESVLEALDAASIKTVLLKGGALSATVYPQPSTRHNHAIDLLVESGQMSAARSVLSSLRFAPERLGPGAMFHQDFRHWTGLALGLHSKPFFLPHFEMPLDAVHARTRMVRIGHRPTRVMSAEDSLVHVCGHAAYSRTRTNLRWACDAFYLLQSNPELNWPAVIDTAVRSRVALPLFVLLRWVNEALEAPVAPERLGELRNRSRVVDSVTAEGIYAALLHTTLSRRRSLDWFGTSWRTRSGFLRFSVLPSRRYMRWKHNVQHDWKLPFYYADRPRRFVRLLLTRQAPQAVAPEDALEVPAGLAKAPAASAKVGSAR